MKKILSVSIVALLAVSPMMATAAALAPQPTYDPTAGSGNATTVAAPYASKTITTEDQQGVASAAYVKGAYNEAIRAVNKVAITANAGQTSEQVAAAVKSGIEAADGNGLQDDANGHLSVKNADSTISVTADGVAVGTITTSNLSGSLATSETANAVNNKLATQGYVDDVAATANSAASSASAAVATANSAASDAADALAAASAAVATANSAASDAADALTAANSAASDASAAVTTANSAASDASAAVTTANSAASDAAAALAAASAAQQTANGRATHAGVEDTIDALEYTTAVTTPIFVAWGDPTATASTSVVTATTSASAASYVENQ